jgi:hypothetical protein
MTTAYTSNYGNLNTINLNQGFLINGGLVTGIVGNATNNNLSNGAGGNLANLAGGK